MVQVSCSAVMGRLQPERHVTAAEAPSQMCRFTVMPIVVHATFQRDENPGKLSRFREWNWWLQVSRSPFSVPHPLSVPKACRDSLVHGASEMLLPTNGRSCALQDPPEYYSEGNFMSYSNGVRAYIDRAEDGYKRRFMTRFHQHQLAAAYQLAAFQHALAIARFHAY